MRNIQMPPPEQAMRPKLRVHRPVTHPRLALERDPHDVRGVAPAMATLALAGAALLAGAQTTGEPASWALGLCGASLLGMLALSTALLAPRGLLHASTPQHPAIAGARVISTIAAAITLLGCTVCFGATLGVVVLIALFGVP